MNRLNTTLTFCVLLYIFTVSAHGQTGWFWQPDAQERGRGLPPGVPRMIDTNGDIESIDHHFTTRAYRDEATRLMLLEANQAAQALHLEEDLPITREKIEASVTPFGFFYLNGLMGYVSTTNYTYRVLNGGKLDHIEIANSYDVWKGFQDSLLPADKVDDQAAFQLATQWLAALSVDVKALNRDCQLTVVSSPVMDYVGSGKEPIRRMFAPTYDVMWKSSNGPAAGVQLYLPEKLLIQLNIEDPKYNLRPPLVFTNLAALFPGQARIITNNPIPPIVIDVGQPSNPEVTFITDSNQPEPAFHDILVSRWIDKETRLNPKHLPLSQLMTLKPVAGPDEWGVSTFDVPVRFDALHYHSDQPLPNGTIDLGRYDADGNFIEYTFLDCTRAPDGNTRISWNINWDSPGPHELRARLIYYQGLDGDQINLIGPPLSYYSSNTCRFYEDSTLFNSDGAELYAKLREPAAKFRVKVTSLKGRLVNDIAGSTTNGEINLAWDLTGLDGKAYTNNSFIGSFYVTYPDDTRTNPPVKAQFNKIGTAGD